MKLGKVNSLCNFSVYLKLLNKSFPEVYLEVELLGLWLWISLHLLDGSKLFSSKLLKWLNLKFVSIFMGMK